MNALQRVSRGSENTLVEINHLYHNYQLFKSNIIIHKLILLTQDLNHNNMFYINLCNDIFDVN